MLVAAHRPELPAHEAAARWLTRTVEGQAAYGMSELVLSAVVRITTRRRIFDPPSTPEAALTYVDSLRARTNRVDVRPGARHWSIFADLVRSTGATGNRVPDAYLAALAIESGCEWVTFDRGFGVYPGLKWRSPLDPG